MLVTEARQLPLTVGHTKIPDCLPLQRGIHLCNNNFTRMFKHAYREKSSKIAQKCFQPLSPGNRNRLFNEQMIEILYASELLEDCSKIEGLLSNARAAAQLR